MQTGHEKALPKSKRYASSGLSPIMRIKIPPTIKAATTAISGNKSSRRSFIGFQILNLQSRILFRGLWSLVFGSVVLGPQGLFLWLCFLVFAFKILNILNLKFEI